MTQLNPKTTKSRAFKLLLCKQGGKKQNKTKNKTPCSLQNQACSWQPRMSHSVASGLQGIEAVPRGIPALSPRPVTSQQHGELGTGICYGNHRSWLCLVNHLGAGLFYPRLTRITQTVSCSPSESEEHAWWKRNQRGAWGAQSVKHLTLAQVMILWV